MASFRDVGSSQVAHIPGFAGAHTQGVTLDDNNVGRYYLAMIKSFGDKETQRIANGEFSRRLPKDVQYRAKMRLDRVNAAVSLEDLRLPPSHRLEPLKGDRKGQWSIRINDQWRICFAWEDGNAWNAEIVDYH